jgi:predicted nucleic acid-binding protein
MRFLDTTIFIYAYYKPKKTLNEKEKEAMKEQAKKIISSISQGKEQVMTTVVHVSEL